MMWLPRPLERGERSEQSEDARTDDGKLSNIAFETFGFCANSAKLRGKSARVSLDIVRRRGAFS